ncbi:MULTISPECIES: Kelch repeat-containing protein [Burkholderia]|uniref:Kelch repeat-containing protein n=1 Tax=Burkholderia TaxID=32008 RepID=UPI00084137A7|nr:MULTISPECIES: hypothetical protein [unclassified Burkholderia]AOK29978.1 hypothetical protein AQ611_11635 [Burkholderia sp. Bp7605]
MNQQETPEALRAYFQRRFDMLAACAGATADASANRAHGPGPGRWIPAGALGQPDTYSAVCQESGAILAVAGNAYQGDLDQQRWDPAGNFPQGTFLTGGLTLLRDGTALAIGFDRTVMQFRGIVYDPARPADSAWQLTGYLTEPRREFALALLHDGQVLAAGGVHTHFLASADLYDPVSMQWRAAAQMTVARAGTATARLRHGAAVLVIGGTTQSGEILRLVERYDADQPKPDWTTVAPMTYQRMYASAIVLPDGRVVVAGGYPASGTLEVYNPPDSSSAVGNWEKPVPLKYDRPFYPAMGIVDGGKVLIAAGGNDKAAEIYDPVKRESRPAASMSELRSFPGYCSAQDHSLVVLGGIDATRHQLSPDTVERFILE